MIELKHDTLVFSFPEVHRDAVLRVEFRRTVRFPEDGRDRVLPSGLGRFPLQHVEDFAHHASPAWIARDGIMLPMHESDALWLSFSSSWEYPFAVQVAVARRDALTGGPWRDGLQRAPQDYLVVPGQQSLAGYCMNESFHQFTAMMDSVDQTQGPVQPVGIQLAVHPLSREAYARHERTADPASPVCYSGSVEADGAPQYLRADVDEDPYDFGDWDQRHRAHCFVYLAGVRAWRAITGSEPRVRPLTADDYARAGVPWPAAAR